MTQGFRRRSRTSGTARARRPGTAAMIATLLSLIGASGAGCHSGIELRPDQLVQLASFQPGGSMEVSTAYGEHVPIEAARATELILRGARWGSGASLAGPSRLASANFELRLFRHVALEVGLLSLGPGLIAWAGGKVISTRIHRVALFA